MGTQFVAVTDPEKVKELIHAGLVWYQSDTGFRWVATKGFLSIAVITGFRSLVDAGRFQVLLED